MTSRGCPFHCRFCNTHVIHKTFRQRSAENVVKELQEIQDRYKSVMIADDNFLADKKRAIKYYQEAMALNPQKNSFEKRAYKGAQKNLDKLKGKTPPEKDNKK